LQLLAITQRPAMHVASLGPMPRAPHSVTRHSMRHEGTTSVFGTAAHEQQSVKIVQSSIVWHSTWPPGEPPSGVPALPPVLEPAPAPLPPDPADAPLPAVPPVAPVPSGGATVVPPQPKMQTAASNRPNFRMSASSVEGTARSSLRSIPEAHQAWRTSRANPAG